MILNVDYKGGEHVPAPLPGDASLGPASDGAGAGPSSLLRALDEGEEQTTAQTGEQSVAATAEATADSSETSPADTPTTQALYGTWKESTIH